MPNILILNYEYPPLGGGAGVVSKYHAEKLSALGYRVTVLTTWFDGEKEIEETENLTIIKLTSKRKVAYKSTPDEWLSWISKSKRFLDDFLVQNKIDFCMAHFALPGGEVARYIHNKFQIPYSVISHGQDIPWFFKKQMFKYHLVTYPWIKLICRKADRLILLTDAMKENADRFMGKQKSKNIIIPNGCDTDTFKPDISKKSQKLKLLFVGRLVEQKAPFVFLNALCLFFNEINAEDAEITVLGDGPLREKMEAFCKRNNLTKQVRFAGWVSKPEMLVEYQSAHIQVISSDAEAMSIAALEALSTGLYVLSTPVSGNTDVIQDDVNGELFPFSDSRVLADKLINYYRTKFQESYEIPSDFLAEFRTNYDWRKIAEKLSQTLPAI